MQIISNNNFNLILLIFRRYNITKENIKEFYILVTKAKDIKER